MSNTKKEPRSERRKKLAVRLVCLVMALLMVGGMAIYIIESVAL